MLHSLLSPLCTLPQHAPHHLCAPHRLRALRALPSGPLLKSLSVAGSWRDPSWEAGASSGGV